jgi:hypothetical protein
MSIEKDIEDLRKAMKGSGTDENTIIKIVANRTQKQRVEIKELYKKKFDRDLINDIKSELRGKLEDAIVNLFKDPIEYDVDQLKKAMKGAGTDEDSLIEIICSRPNLVLKQIKEKYKEKIGKDLESDLKSDIKGDLQKILLPIVQLKRSDNKKPNVDECQQKAKKLQEGGVKKWGTDESVFSQILSTSSPEELICISQEYHKITGETILEAIDKEFSGNMKKAYKAIIYAMLSPSEYFATRVKDAIKGFGTNDNLLMRILISRDEIDMPQIKAFYSKLYGKDMVDDIKSDIGGDYEKLMVELCSH